MDGVSNLRMNEGASCEVQVPIAFGDEVQQKCRELTNLKTEPDKRGQGFAKKLLEQVCQEADNAKMALIIYCKPEEEGIVSTRLQKFYAKFGFVVFQTSPCLMVRPHG